MKNRKVRPTTVADLCALTDYSRDQMQGLLRSLPTYADHEGQARIAREFSRHDVLVIAVAVRLESKLGMKRAAIAAVVEGISTELRGARPKSASPYLHISFAPPTVQFLAKKQIDGEGMVVALTPVFEKVDIYFSGDPAEDEPQQEFGFNQPLVALKRK